MSNSPRYGTNTTNTSKYMIDLMNEFIKMPRGVFNNSSRKNIDVPIGGIVPFDIWEMLPNSDAYLKYDLQLLSKNPTVKRLLSAMKAEIRVYKVNYNDCWEGWNNFITKGRSGKVSLSIPYLSWDLGTKDRTSKLTTSLPYNPASTLNIAPPVFLGSDTDSKKFSVTYNSGLVLTSDLQSSGQTGISTLNGTVSSTALRISALPFVFYNKVVKKFQNANLLQENPHWYPENENHDMILPYSASGAVTTSDYDNPTRVFKYADGVETDFNSTAPNVTKNNDGNYASYPFLNVLQYAQRKGDMFNTGSPFPDLIRGDIPTLQVLNAQLNSADVDISKVAGQDDFITSFKYAGQVDSDPAGTWQGNAGTVDNLFKQSGEAFYYALGSDTEERRNILSEAFKGSVKLNENALKGTISDKTIKGISFSMSQWRYLATMTVMKERLALTDGSYNQMIQSLFGHNPNWHSHDCRYVGGSSQQIVFSEVVNTASSSFAPLGETAGRAVSNQENNIIHVHSDDFGMFMAVLVIQPDEYYSQGVKKMFSRLENAQQYFPILNNLSPDATLNKELFVSGDNTVDEDVFNYQERFAYYKSQRNEVSGLMQIAISKIGDIGAYIWNRLFDSTPNFNHEFNTLNPTGNEKAIFASTNQAEFCAVIGRNFRFVAPIPEDSRPSDMGISY